jgi:hypothetical protein
VGSVLCGGGAHNSTQAIGRLPATNVNLGPAVPAVEADVASHGGFPYLYIKNVTNT